MTATTIGAHPDRIDLTVHAGDLINFDVPVVNADGTTVDALVDWTIAAQVRATPTGPVLHTFTATIEGGTTARVAATSAATAAWAWSSAQWDLILTSPVGVAHVLCSGWIRVYPTITH